MSSTHDRVTRAVSEIQRQSSFTWSEAAIDVRCRLLTSELDWPWTDLGRSEFWTPVEEVHAMSGYTLSHDTLCDMCIQFDATECMHQPTGTALVQAASNGCRLCTLILDSFKPRSDSLEILLQHDNPIVFDIRQNQDIATITAGYEGRFDHKGLSGFFKAERPLALLTQADSSIHRGKANTIEFIGQKIRECLLDHVRCPNTSTQRLPLRLIDVGCPGGDQEHQPRLWINPWNENTHNSNITEPPSGVYAALSYCWGSVPFYCLTPETLGHLQEKIPMEQLPQTFKDAIEITRGLGIRYLWIDALCVVQGQRAEAKADWSEQSLQMDMIYSRAAVVLGAAASADPYEGITCSPYHYRDIVELLPIRAEMPKNGDDGLRRCFVASREFTPENTLGPLHMRGWAFQERILATRYIHLGREKIFFECDHGRQFEYYHDDFFRLQLNARLDPHPSFESWHVLVEEYSKRRLRFATDNLIALSGVAKHFAKRAENPGKYLAGLWEENLVKDLMWHVKSPSRRIGTGPSWSWAARGSEISYERVRRHFCSATCAKTVGTDVTNFPALYGFHCSGKVVVKAYLRKIFLHGEQDCYHVVGFQAPKIQSEHQDTRFRIGTCVMDFLNAEPSFKRIADRLQHQEFLGWENIFETWCLQLHPGRGILLQATNENVDEFERIGYFEYREQNFQDDAMSKKEWNSNCNPIAQAVYLSDHPFRWFRAATEAGQDDLIEDWFGDPEAIVTLI